MTKIMRQFAASISNARKAQSAKPRETQLTQAMPHHVTMAAIGVTAPEFI